MESLISQDSDLTSYWKKEKEEWDNYRNSGLFDKVDIPHCEEVLPLLSKLQDIDRCPESYLQKIVEEDWYNIFDILLDEYSSNEDKVKCYNIYYNVRWIKILNNNIFKLNDLSCLSKYIPIMNYLCYYYNSNNNKDKLSPLGAELLKTTMFINKYTIDIMHSDKFIGNSITSEQLNWVIMGRYSGLLLYNMDLPNAGQMIHEIITRTNLTKDGIITIYNILYDSLSSLVDGVFHFNPYIMNYTDKQQEMYNRCIHALLAYINMQESMIIKKVLENFSINHSYFYSGLPVFLKITDIQKYSRILAIYNNISMYCPVEENNEINNMY